MLACLRIPNLFLVVIWLWTHLCYFTCTVGPTHPGGGPQPLSYGHRRVTGEFLPFHQKTKRFSRSSTVGKFWHTFSHSYKGSWKHLVCPASLVRGRKEKGDQPSNDVCHNPEIELLSPWSMDVFILIGITQSLLIVVSVWTLYQGPFWLLSLPSGFSFWWKIIFSLETWLPSEMTSHVSPTGHISSHFSQIVMFLGCCFILLVELKFHITHFLQPFFTPLTAISRKCKSIYTLQHFPLALSVKSKSLWESVRSSIIWALFPSPKSSHPSVTKFWSY